MNIWNKKFNKNNKSVYEISKELNIPEDKIKEVINGERQVPTNDVDRVNEVFSSNNVERIMPIERTLMEKFFKENSINELKDKFGFENMRDMAKALNVGTSSLYRLNDKDIKKISNKTLKKYYEFFQNEWNKKVKTPKYKCKSKKVWNYQLPKSRLNNEVIEWYENTDLKALRNEKGLSVRELVAKLGFANTYCGVYYKFERKTDKVQTSNWLIVQQLYNYYHGLELMNTRPLRDEELFGNINTPIYEYEEIEHLDIEPDLNKVEVETPKWIEEPIFKTVGEQNKEDSVNILTNEKNADMVVENECSEVIDTTGFVSIEEYNKVYEELNRYKFLIDMLRRNNE